MSDKYKAKADYYRAKKLKGTWYDSIWGNMGTDLPSKTIAGIKLVTYIVKNKKIKNKLYTNKFYKTAADSMGIEYEEAPIDHPANMIFNPPNEVDKSFQIFLRNTISKYLALEYGAFWQFDMKNKYPSNIYLLKDIEPIRRRSKIVGWKRLLDTGRYETLDNDTLLHFYRFDPYTHEPYSKMTMLSQLVYLLANIRAWNSGLFDGENLPPVFVTVKEWLNNKGREKIGKSLKDFFHPFKKNRIGLFEGDAKITKIFDSNDFDFRDANEVLREEILAGSNIPPALAGIYRYANYANSEAQQEIFWTISNIPIMMYIREMIKSTLIDPYFDNVFIDWKWEDVPKHTKVELQKVEIELKKEELRSKKIQNEKAELELELYTNETKSKIHIIKSKSLGIKPDFDIIDMQGKKFLQIKMNKDERENLKKIYDRYYLKRNENKMLKNIKGWYQEVIKTTIKDYEKGDFAISIEREMKLFNRYIKEDLDLMILRSINKVRKETEALEKGMWDISCKQGDIYDRWQDIIPEDLLNKAGELSRHIVTLQKGLPERFIRETMKMTFDNLFKYKTSVQDFRRGLEETGKVFFASDALTTARTLTGQALNNARHESFDYYDVVSTEWLSSEDKHVRPDHADEDGVIVDIAEKYPHTDLLHPHDFEGLLSQIINCRCNEVAVQIYINNELVNLSLRKDILIKMVIERIFRRF